MKDSLRPHYPLAVRVLHAVIGLTVPALIVTGLCLHYEELRVALSFRNAVRGHETSGIVFAVAYLLYVAATWMHRGFSHYRIEQPRGAALWSQARWYLRGMFRGDARPFPTGPARKFNPLQVASYAALVGVVLPLLVVTGTMLFFPEAAPETVAGRGGVWPVALLHLFAGWLVTLFFMLHLYMITTGPTLGAYLRRITSGDVHHVTAEEQGRDDADRGKSVDSARKRERPVA